MFKEQKKRGRRNLKKWRRRKLENKIKGERNADRYVLLFIRVSRMKFIVLAFTASG
jgi:hypothetical protein